MDEMMLAPDFHDHRAGREVELHRHAEGQVLLATTGRMEVRLPERRVEIGPATALWVPGGMPHAARSLEDTAFRGIMIIDARNAALLPGRASTFAASPVLLASTPELTAGRARRRALAAALLLDELVDRLASPAAGLAALAPAFIAVCARVLDDPAAAPSLDEAARQTGRSRRSFSRGFRLATGTSWAAWVRQARMARAAALLFEGARVTDAALAVGYATSSSFSVAFARRAGS